MKLISFSSVESLTVTKLDRLTITQSIKIIKTYYKNGDGRWTKFCSKNCRPSPVVQALIPRIYDVVNDHLNSVVAWAGLYMDVGVDPNAKYALMCLKTVLNPENDEKSTCSGLWHHIHNSDNFSGTSETMMHMPLNICNQSSFFKFLHNFANCLRSWTNM